MKKLKKSSIGAYYRQMPTSLRRRRFVWRGGGNEKHWEDGGGPSEHVEEVVPFVKSDHCVWLLFSCGWQGTDLRTEGFKCSIMALVLVRVFLLLALLF